MPSVVTVNDLVIEPIAKQSLRRDRQLFLEVAITVALQQDHLVSLYHGHGGTGNFPLLERLIHKVIEVAKAGLTCGSRRGFPRLLLPGRRDGYNQR